jgi:hypothetical protein
MIGGKTYNMKALEACLEFMREGQDTDSEAELDSEDEQENSCHIRLLLPLGIPSKAVNLGAQ